MSETRQSREDNNTLKFVCLVYIVISFILYANVSLITKSENTWNSPREQYLLSAQCLL